jgi:hypothetical protein
MSDFCSHLREGLLYGDPLIRPTAAQHTDPLPKTGFCVRRVAASDPEADIDPAPPASPLAEPVVAPTEPVLAPNEPPWSSPSSTCCASCSPCISPTVDPLPPPTVDPATPVSIFDVPDKDVTWRVINLTRQALRIIWHQTSSTHAFSPCQRHAQVRYWVPSLPIATGIEKCSVYLKD